MTLAQGVASGQQEQLSLKAAQIDAASEAILQIDMEGRLVHFSQALCTMTGYSAAELTGIMLHEIKPPELALCIADNLKLLRASGQLNFESAYLAEDGRAVPVEVNARTMVSEGRLLVLSVARDITQRKRADLREHACSELLERIRQMLTV